MNSFWAHPSPDLPNLSLPAHAGLAFPAGTTGIGRNEALRAIPGLAPLWSLPEGLCPMTLTSSISLFEVPPLSQVNGLLLSCTKRVTPLCSEFVTSDHVLSLIHPM
jgi:hypothetical protein